MKANLIFAFALIAALAASGCKKKSSETTTPAPVPASDKCTHVATKVGAAVETEVRSTAPDHAKAKLTPIFAEIQGIIKTRCAEDKWPDAFTDCVLAAPDAAAIGACNLPPESEKSLSEAMETLTPKIMEAMAEPGAEVTPAPDAAK